MQIINNVYSKPLACRRIKESFDVTFQSFSLQIQQHNEFDGCCLKETLFRLLRLFHFVLVRYYRFFFPSKIKYNWEFSMSFDTFESIVFILHDLINSMKKISSINLKNLDLNNRLFYFSLDKYVIWEFNRMQRKRSFLAS